MCGARDMVFPYMNMLSFWVYLLAVLVAALGRAESELASARLASADLQSERDRLREAVAALERNDQAHHRAASTGERRRYVRGQRHLAGRHAAQHRRPGLSGPESFHAHARARTRAPAAEQHR